MFPHFFSLRCVLESSFTNGLARNKLDLMRGVESDALFGVSLESERRRPRALAAELEDAGDAYRAKVFGDLGP